jgi:hypothetical protein
MSVYIYLNYGSTGGYRPLLVHGCQQGVQIDRMAEPPEFLENIRIGRRKYKGKGKGKVVPVLN